MSQLDGQLNTMNCFVSCGIFIVQSNQFAKLLFAVCKARKFRCVSGSLTFESNYLKIGRDIETNFESIFSETTLQLKMTTSKAVCFINR